MYIYMRYNDENITQLIQIIVNSKNNECSENISNLLQLIQALAKKCSKYKKICENNHRSGDDIRDDRRDDRGDNIRDGLDDSGNDILKNKFKINVINTNYLNYLNLDFDPDRPVVTLQNMIIDMKIRENNNKLMMPENKNHEIDYVKMNEWIKLQCNQEAIDLATLFKNYTTYISFEEFYQSSVNCFEELYKIVKDKSYCIFTKESLGEVNYDAKSSYWMLNLMLNYFIQKEYTNLPQEFILCSNEQFDSICPTSNYDYYITLDDASYSGGQIFTDAILTKSIENNKIIIVVPYISKFALNKFGNNTTFKRLIYDKTMEYWWENQTIKINEKEYILNNYDERTNVFKLLQKYFPSPRANSPRWGNNNFMYYFDHKIADYASSFPTVYQVGIIKDFDENVKISTNTHDDNREKFKEVCKKTTYLPFIKNCNNDLPIFDDIGNKAKTKPENLCVVPWYKFIFDKNYNKKILVLDFDDTITKLSYGKYDIESTNINEIFDNFNLNNLLNFTWDNLVPVYILSRRDKDDIITILNRFYTNENIKFKKIYEKNILGRLHNFTYNKKVMTSQEKINFWANYKVNYLNFLSAYEKIDKENLFFYDDSKENINAAIKQGFKNSELVDPKKNVQDVYEKFKNKFSS